MLPADIPDILYRGDADTNNYRHLKQTLNHGQYLTNFLNGGEGRKVIETPLKILIDQHVGFGWDKTCFLSFTSDKSKAFQYGIGDVETSLLNIEDEFIEFLEDGNDYEFVLLMFHPEKVQWCKIDDGVYEGLYKPISIEFEELVHHYRIILIDVYKALTKAGDCRYDTSLRNSKRDKEWLIFPATWKLFNFNRLEYSGKIDASPFTYKRMKRFC